MNQEKIGGFIAEVRKEKEMTQAELGARLGVTNKTISRWENGNYMPDISLMQSLCEELEISINEFLSGERISDEDFRKKADSNIISSLNREKLIRREKRASDFFGGAGTGILLSALYSPDSIRRTVVSVIGIAMICIGWYCRAKLDRYIIDKSEN
ncbi:helix-turn-helix transcriptional regulator [Marinisporobacter balticus]|uniref:DNA-binding XRE family transcriptional regulator n=1 Tax=Marinisporobacter balticus TaxID=2018667 RepID=A0A4R2KQN4_9FIRM|nr:helix-turn-helix transcriptional regulator [Marinisporobacter balticus]TCO68915.1 DNA-binding XRE family transcriptional regulator [Marinisporobacter balticus]